MAESINLVAELCDTIKTALYMNRLNNDRNECVKKCSEAVTVYQSKKQYYPNTPGISTIRHNTNNTIDVVFIISPDNYYSLKVSEGAIDR